MMRKSIGYVSALLLSASLSYAQPLGVFDNQADVGNPDIPGQATFDGGIYTVDAVGNNLGRRAFADQFYFVYKEMSGSFALESDIFVLSPDVGGGGLMVRQNLDADSPHASFMRVGSLAGGNTNAVEGSVFPHVRGGKGGGTMVDGDYEPGGYTDTNIGPIRLERIGNSIHYYTMDTAGAWVFRQTEVVPMTDPVVIGLAASAYTAADIGLYEFTDVAITEYPLAVNRTLPTETFTAGAQLNGVQVRASARSGQTVNAVVTEVVPGGSTLTNVSVTGGTVSTDAASGRIVWTLDNFSGNATLSYDVKLRNNATSVAWQGTFNDGVNRASYIGGNAVLPKVPVFNPPTSPFVVEPGKVTLIQAEQGAALDPAAGQFGINVDPRVPSGITVLDVGGSSAHFLEYPFRVTQAGTYYFFGQVRSEDGNSDSWHFEVDLPPAGNDTSYWTVSSRKAFAREWISSVNPAQDPRPFTLQPGEYYAYLANREDSTAIDWIAVTDNPNVNLIGYNEVTGSFPVLTPFEKVNVSNPTPVQLVNGSAFIEAEDAYLVKTPADRSNPFVIVDDTAASGGLYADSTLSQADAIGPNELNFVFNVQTAGTYRVMTRVRTISGTEDSFYVGMDDDLGVDLNAYRFQGCGTLDNNFHTCWMRVDGDPDLAWDLNAGVHTLRVHVREDGTQIDWVYITNNLDLDPATFVPPTGDPGTAVDDFMIFN